MWKIIIILIVFIAVIVGIVIFTIKNVEAPVDNKINKSTNNMNDLTLTSLKFQSGESIPKKYTCDGENINPPFNISNIPENAKSLAIVMDDPDAKPVAGKIWDHWIIWNIPISINKINEGEEPEGIHGIGTGGNLKYNGPCPPDKMHTYHFKLYALDGKLNLKEGSDKKELENAMDSHIIDQAELLGTYNRQ